MPEPEEWQSTYCDESGRCLLLRQQRTSTIDLLFVMAPVAGEEYLSRRERLTTIYYNGGGRRVLIVMIAGDDYLSRRQRVSIIDLLFVIATAADEEYLLRRGRLTTIYCDGSGRRVFIVVIAGDDYVSRRQRATIIDLLFVIATAAGEEYLLRRWRATIIRCDGSGRRVFLMMIAGDEYVSRRQRASTIDLLSVMATAAGEEYLLRR